MRINITVAKTAGFCFGVKRAVDIAYQVCAQKDSVYMLGPIIHNEIVVKQLAEQGAIIVSGIDEIKENGVTAIIRAHGLDPDSYRQMEAKNIQIVDATCPFVKKIHNIVNKYHGIGYEIIIIGDKHHPEVIGINGWSDNNAYIFKEVSEVKDFIAQNPQFCQKQLCVVAQTTINQKKMKDTIEYLQKLCTNIIVFDTICSATIQRQNEAVKIAQNCDVMLVVGSSDSSNTRKLVEVCQQYCGHVYLVNDASDLRRDMIFDGANVGITAGASTPAFIIKEVINIMSQENNQNESQEISFAEAFEQSIKTLNTRDILTGVVVGIAPNEIHVDLGTKHDGYIPISELTDDINVKPEDLVKIGQEIEVFVVRVNDVEGTIMLSKKKIDAMKGWQEVEKSADEGSIVHGTVTEAIKGGVIVLVNGVRVFVPASLAAERYTADLSTLVGKPVDLKIIEMNKQRRRITGSIKAVLDEQRAVKAQKIWDEIENGKIYQGVVKSLTSYGAFVDIGGVDGMVHVSELSWNRIKHPSDVLKVGDELEVYIINADKETRKISLGHKKASDNPWEIFKGKFDVGDVVSCKIVKLMPFGAFAEIIPGVDGLIHISQISDKRIAKAGDVLTTGQVVDAKITDLDLENKKVNLSIRALLEEIAPAAPVNETEAEAVDGE
jgi:4-hydroxy-3-methylbut-2-enyl diphosphate reductase